MFYYCMGIRVNDVFQEYTCEHREHCPYYANVRLSVAFSQPDEYQELPTYNNFTCNYFDISWKKETLKTSDAQMDGLQTLLSRG